VNKPEDYLTVAEVTAAALAIQVREALRRQRAAIAGSVLLGWPNRTARRGGARSLS
jgi:hypothetical protein